MRDATTWTALYNEPENTLPSGTLQVYCKRGWCRLEVLAALTPKKFWRGDWRPGPRNVRFRYHSDPRAPGAGPLVKAGEIGSPMTGGGCLNPLPKRRATLRQRRELTLCCVSCFGGADFTVADDVAMIAPIIVSIANRFPECGNPCFRRRQGPRRLLVLATRDRKGGARW